VGNEYRNLEVSAKVTRKKDGSTEAAIEVVGLPDGIAGFGAHVHAGTCELDPPGGPHYKLDATIEAEAEANEIWLNFDADAQGAATNTNAKPTHLARPDAIAVVVHEPVTGTRLTCVELQ
jgi:superoxide dismutase, Cu-Zn family